VLIPILYLKGISTGDFEEALIALLGKDACGLSASSVGRLKEAWLAMKFGSLCALGGFTPYLVMSGPNHFSEDFSAPPRLSC
jgi:NADH:ubiquinone oxidoreductase subunit F (NADH-binding)